MKMHLGECEGKLLTESAPPSSSELEHTSDLRHAFRPPFYKSRRTPFFFKIMQWTIQGSQWPQVQRPGSGDYIGSNAALCSTNVTQIVVQDPQEFGWGGGGRYLNTKMYLSFRPAAFFIYQSWTKLYSKKTSRYWSSRNMMIYYKCTPAL